MHAPRHQRQGRGGRGQGITPGRRGEVGARAGGGARRAFPCGTHLLLRLRCLGLGGGCAAAGKGKEGAYVISTVKANPATAVSAGNQHTRHAVCCRAIRRTADGAAVLQCAAPPSASHQHNLTRPITTTLLHARAAWHARSLTGLAAALLAGARRCRRKGGLLSAAAGQGCRQAGKRPSVCCQAIRRTADGAGQQCAAGDTRHTDRINSAGRVARTCCTAQSSLSPSPCCLQSLAVAGWQAHRAPPGRTGAP